MRPYLCFLHTIFSKTRVRSFDLSVIQKLDEALGFVHRKFLTIHVAGTNGKGSVATKIASVLSLSGYRTGLFISPHISSFRERITINDEMISEEEVYDEGSKILALSKKLDVDPTFFDVATLLAFVHFAKKNVDVAVIETGLGGRLDATNVIVPVLSIISSIAFDHEEVLGETLEEIAREKAGIIKRGVPVVVGPNADFPIVREIASLQNCPYFVAKQKEGFYEIQNSEIAKISIDRLKEKFHFSHIAIEEGLKKMPKCRFEVHSQNSPLAKRFVKFPHAIIFDVAHNPSGIIAVLQEAKKRYPHHSFRIIFGLSREKDLRASSEIISRFASVIHLVASKNPRAFSVEDLSREFSSFAIPFIAEASVKDGVLHSLDQAKPQEIVIVFGSFYLVGEARAALGFQEPFDER